MEKSFVKLIAQSIRSNWDYPALSDYQGATYTYGDIGEHIEKIRLLFEEAGIKPGDKVAMIGRNSAGWAMTFLGILSYGCVAVPILHEFHPSSVHHIVNHSESLAFFVSSSIWENLDMEEMGGLNIILDLNSLKVLHAKKKKLNQENLANQLMRKHHQFIINFQDLHFHISSDDNALAMISYTSGTSGFSKGVMIPQRALWNNVFWAQETLPGLSRGVNVVSILPLAHMYGLAFELLTELASGMHVHFLTKTPSPRLILEMFSKNHPWIIIMVPLIMEKIIRKSIFPLLQTTRMKLLLKVPLLKERIYKKIRDKLVQALGGRLYEVIIGGAPFSSDVENFLHLIRFPYTTGYGMTECAPLITYAPWNNFHPGSVGKIIGRMEIRIDSQDPRRIPGEIQVRGCNVMLGYYRNEQETQAAFTEDGWLHTGDLGIMDADGYLFIKGRSKNMILGQNGQNIYPEEIEDSINSLPYVEESLVVMRENKLVALIHPNIEKMDADKISMSEVRKIIQVDITRINQQLAAYCRLSSFQIYEDEFEKTPKRSIKRYLYK